MKSKEIRQKFLDFFEKRDHAIIPSASLLPENDPSVLFNTAGMQPLVPYLLGEKHPAGTRLANSQKCLRTVDVDEIGDNTHATFFEMLGNWSLGDYFKKETIEWSYELLTDKVEGFGLDPQRLYVTCFEGDGNAPKDDESAGIWREIFEKNNVTGERIYFMSAESNWWSAGDNGPCGPDSEIFYDVTGQITVGMTKDEYIKADDEQKVVEIWNDVFMEYEKKEGKVIGKLEQKNIDTGSGFERLAMIVQGKESIFDTDIFSGIISTIKENSELENQRSERIIADHIRSSVFLIGDGATPSNTDQGYILRRLLRRAVIAAGKLRMDTKNFSKVSQIVIDEYKDHYKNLEEKSEEITETILTEVETFIKTLSHAERIFEKIFRKGENTISADDVFKLVTTHGMPFELVLETAQEKNMEIDKEGFEILFAEHKEKSKIGSDQKFKGGLAGNSEMELKYHTATHLLNAALGQVLGDHVEQKGSNITPDRLRFDFSHGEKMTPKQKDEVTALVNKWISEDYPVSFEDMPIEKAKELGAIGVFGDKYGNVVKVYTVGDDEKGIISRELCGGPHVTNTGILGVFKIKKEEASSAGIRRIKAILQ
jgi:alanyl-tRNA synthetase